MGPADQPRTLSRSRQCNSWMHAAPRSPVCACSLVSSLLLSGATMSQQSSLTQSAHSVRQVLTAYSFVAGLWLDWLLRRLDRSRAETRENLGIEMTNLANDIDNALALVDRFRLQDFSPRLMSAFIKAKQVGLWTPDVRMPLNVVMDYLRHVGTLLSDGHFADAKQAALERKQAFAEHEKRAK
jgi:hypothetical protein